MKTFTPNHTGTPRISNYDSSHIKSNNKPQGMHGYAMVTDPRSAAVLQETPPRAPRGSPRQCRRSEVLFPTVFSCSPVPLMFHTDSECDLSRSLYSEEQPEAARCQLQ